MRLREKRRKKKRKKWSVLARKISTEWEAKGKNYLCPVFFPWNNSFRIINTVEKIAFRNIIYAFTCLSVGLFSPSFTVEAFHFSFFLFFFYFVSSQNSFSTFFLRNPRFGNGCVEREVSKTRSIDRIPRQFAVEGKFVCALCAASNSIPRSSGSLTSLFVDTNLASLLLLRLLRPPAAKGHHR